MRLATLLVPLYLAVFSHAAHADPLRIPLNIIDEKGDVLTAGSVTVTASPHGLIFTPSMTGLPAGMHGFHIHEKPSCAPGMKNGKSIAAFAAGGHWDPDKAGRHAGPYGNGHKGDLPPIYASHDGKTLYPVLAPRLRSLDEIRGHALTVHLGSDNFDDAPAPLGGGGERVACGVIG
jgi:Cu-Zn family superoxide dismutase